MKSVSRYLLATVAHLAALIPVYWLITISLKREIDQFAYPPRWIGFAPTLEHYADAFSHGSFGLYFMNSFTWGRALGGIAAYLGL